MHRYFSRPLCAADLHLTQDGLRQCGAAVEDALEKPGKLVTGSGEDYMGGWVAGAQEGLEALKARNDAMIAGDRMGEGPAGRVREGGGRGVGDTCRRIGKIMRGLMCRKVVYLESWAGWLACRDGRELAHHNGSPAPSRWKSAEPISKRTSQINGDELPQKVDGWRRWKNPGK